MSTVIDELVVELQLDGTFARNEADKIKRDTEKAAKEAGEEFKKTGDKAKEAGQKAKEGAKQAQSGWTKLADTLKSSLTSIATGAMALYGVYSTFSSYLSTADAMGKFADSIGQNIEDVHAWSEAVIRSGGSAEGFQGSLKSLSTQLSKMSTTGKSRAGNILESVGIDAGGIGRARKSLDVMLEISDKMQEMSKEEALGFGASLGLDSGTIMLLQQGRDAVSDLIRKQKELGVYTKEDARITAEFNDAVADSKQAFMSFASIMFRMVTPALKGVVDSFTGFVSFLRQHEVAVQAFFTMLAGVITYMLIPAFAQLAKTLWRSPLTWLIAGIALLAIVIEDFYGWANGKESLFQELWESIFEGPEGREDALAFIEDFKKSIEELTQALKDLTDAQKGISTEHPLGEGFDNWLTQLQEEANKNSYSPDDFWGYQFGDVGKWFESILHEIENDVQATLNDLAMDIDTFFNDLQATGSKAVDSVKGFFTDLKNSIMSSIGEAIDWALDKLAELAAAVRATPIIGGAIDYAFGGGGSSSTVNTKIGQITVHTPATDANGIASSMGGAINRKFNPAMANGGVK